MIRTIALFFLLTTFCIASGQNDSSSVIAVQAEFPGGQSAHHKYIMTHVAYKVSPDNDAPVEKVIAKFFVDENGKTTDAKIVKTSRHTSIDKQLITAIYDMPKWSPAENRHGKKVRQEITIPLYLCTR